MKRPESSYVGAVPASMNFKSVEYSGDQIAGSFNDEYKIEQVQFSIADYL